MSNGTLTQWNRLEGRPRKNDFSRSMRAEIRDALWMMTRQWQLGELTAEDNGSPVSAKIFYRNTRLDTLTIKSEEPQELSDDLPLETLVERENVQRTNDKDQDFINDLSLGMALSKRLTAVIKKTFINPQRDSILKALAQHPELQFYQEPEKITPSNFDDIAMRVNAPLHEMHTAFNSRTFHGGKIYTTLRDGKALGTFVPNLPTIAKNTLTGLGKNLVAWFDTLFNQLPEGAEAAWDPNHLEYQFATGSPDEEGKAIPLISNEYPGGRLDWYASDIAQDIGSSGAALRPELNVQDNDEVFPAEVAFTGMPHSRWWEIEDGKLNFTQVQPNKTDLAKLLFAEFGLLYSNDWFVMPLTLPFGSLTKIDRIEIKDTFGQHTISKHYKNQPDNTDWGLFGLSNAADGNDPVSQYLYLPPVAHDILIGEPLEKVNFIQDEMANMVWGIELIIQDGLGAGIDGTAMGLQLREYYNRHFQPDTIEKSNEAPVAYKLVTEVPENWIPFIPVKPEGAGPDESKIRLQRAQLPRIIGNLEPSRIIPRTGMLVSESSPYYIFTEEIDKSGTFVELHWQRTRMANGKNVVWLGRKRTNGRGGGSSVLAYDQLKSE